KSACRQGGADSLEYAGAGFLQGHLQSNPRRLAMTAATKAGSDLRHVHAFARAEADLGAPATLLQEQQADVHSYEATGKVNKVVRFERRGTGRVVVGAVYLGVGDPAVARRLQAVEDEAHQLEAGQTVLLEQLFIERRERSAGLDQAGSQGKTCRG